MVIAGTPINSDHYLKNLDIGLDTVSLRTPTCDAGVDFSFFIDTTELAKSIVKKNSKPVIDITEIDNPADWVFNEEVLHPNGGLKMRWQEKYNERFRKVKHGLFEEWDCEGTLLRKINFSYGKLDGIFRKFYPNGAIKLEGTYINLLKEGKWVLYGINGEIQYQCVFSSDTIVTNDVDLVKNKDFMTVNLFEYSVNYENKDTLATECYPNNQLKRKAYFDDNGNLLQVKIWYENGQLSNEKNYENGSPAGIWKSWNQDGKIIQTIEYINKDISKVKIYRLYSEILMMEGIMVNGEKDGVWYEYENDGKLYQKVKYENGKFISVIKEKK